MGSRLTSIIGIRAVSFKHFVESTGIGDSTRARCEKTGFPAETQQSLTASEQREAAFAFSQAVGQINRAKRVSALQKAQFVFGFKNQKSNLSCQSLRASHFFPSPTNNAKYKSLQNVRFT
jgi:hypothetical protein